MTIIDIDIEFGQKKMTKIKYSIKNDFNKMKL